MKLIDFTYTIITPSSAIIDHPKQFLTGAEFMEVFLVTTESRKGRKSAKFYIRHNLNSTMAPNAY